MTKWYESCRSDDGAIISSRIRLARNLSKYPFPEKLKGNPDLSKKLAKELTEAVINDRTPIGKDFEQITITENNAYAMRLLEKHCISPEFLSRQGERDLLLSLSESVAIMINEEDHVRIQSIFPGDSLDEGYFLADKIDDLIEESVEYAFHKDYGYLTACPTNAGTGIRVSYMLHLPALETGGKLRGIASTVAKLGVAVRGIYGEGSEPLGSIYQISNQTTLGKNEQEIIAMIKSVSSKLIEQEIELRDKLLFGGSELEDKVYRSYGILKHARRLSSKEAMGYLSDVRLGFVSGRLLEPRPKMTIYNIMMSSQIGGITEMAGNALNESERDLARAEFIRAALNDSKEGD